MKGTGVLVTIAIAAVCASRSDAQTSPAPPVSSSVTAVRPDLSASVGWLNVNKSSLDDYNDWYNRGVQGAVAFGWYWTPHLKTEVEPSASTRVEFDSSREELINGRRAHVVSEFGFSTRRLTLSQQYQFGENAWFHPHLGAGVDFNWERTARTDRFVYFYDPPGRQPPLVPQNVSQPNRTDLHIRPFVAAGLKAYMTPRAFARSDLRLVIGDRIEEVVLRFGLGVDF
jgi:hypothetical protein